MARKLPERRAEPRRWTGWISAATALALTGGLWLAGVLPQAQQILYDAAVAHASPGAMSEAVLVDIDARSLAAAGGNWTYDNHAALIDRLAQVGASTVVYALPLAPPATPTDAQALVSSIAQAQNVIWPAVFADHGPAASLPTAFYRSTLAALGGRGPAMVPVQMGPFAEAAAGVGHLQWRADSDGTLRQVPLVLSHDNVGVPALALLAAQRVLHLSAEDISWRGGSSSPGLLLGSLVVGVDAGAVMRPVFGSSLPRLAAADVVANKVPTAALRDKTVVVGMTAEPQAAVWTVPGGGVFARIRCGGPDLGRIACGPLRNCAELGPHPGMGCRGRHGFGGCGAARFAHKSGLGRCTGAGHVAACHAMVVVATRLACGASFGRRRSGAVGADAVQCLGCITKTHAG